MMQFDSYLEPAKERGMIPVRCIDCQFCSVSKRAGQGFKKEITLICEVTGQQTKVDKCPAFY